MNYAKEARRLANFISGLGDNFPSYDLDNKFCYNHMGALTTDIILQSGLNYTTVVKPRVKRVLLQYPEADTTTRFCDIIEQVGLEKIINWSHEIKLKRILDLLDFLITQEIDTIHDFKSYLNSYKNQQRLLEIKGIGPKTVDYLLKLLNFDTVAVDRHIYSFVEMAEIKTDGYHQTKKLVEHAADFLEISRAGLDYGIWNYVSNKQHLNIKEQAQLAFEFL